MLLIYVDMKNNHAKDDEVWSDMYLALSDNYTTKIS